MPAPYDNSDRAIRCSAGSSSSNSRSVSARRFALQKCSPVVGRHAVEQPRQFPFGHVAQQGFVGSRRDVLERPRCFFRLQGRKYELLLGRCKILQQVGNVLRLPFGQYFGKLCESFASMSSRISGNVSFSSSDIAASRSSKPKARLTVHEMGGRLRQCVCRIRIHSPSLNVAPACTKNRHPTSLQGATGSASAYVEYVFVAHLLNVAPACTNKRHPTSPPPRLTPSPPIVYNQHRVATL